MKESPAWESRWEYWPEDQHVEIELWGNTKKAAKIIGHAPSLGLQDPKHKDLGEGYIIEVQNQKIPPTKSVIDINAPFKEK